MYPFLNDLMQQRFPVPPRINLFQLYKSAEELICSFICTYCFNTFRTSVHHSVLRMLFRICPRGVGSLALVLHSSTSTIPLHGLKNYCLLSMMIQAFPIA